MQQNNQNQTTTVEPSTKREYKDTVIRMLFRDKRRLLELCNGLNQTKHTDPDDIEITTLENAIYLGIKNDISCVLDRGGQDEYL